MKADISGYAVDLLSLSLDSLSDSNSQVIYLSTSYLFYRNLSIVNIVFLPPLSYLIDQVKRIEVIGISSQQQRRCSFSRG